ncbi:MAG: peptide-methionine (S)-S-oxide reductase MsrA [Bacteroidales bacterium]|nr:peptide-methionine (S)-S-oxide reductase MsrA [Bacteroidales bacterium]
MTTRIYILLMIAMSLGISSCHGQSPENKDFDKMKEMKTDTATFAAGCFWCVEEQFRQLKGVVEVISGYTGGTFENPSYNDVVSGETGHAEAINVIYNPNEVTYDFLLSAFFQAHDPTQLNRQGADIGTQYRSAIFYHNVEQKELAEYYIFKLNEEKAYPGTIVTEISPFSVFYKAENYHQDYYEKNPYQGYCQIVIKPKLEKFRAVFKDHLKE